MTEWGEALLDRLAAYGKSDAYPFHMPGHKRRSDCGYLSFPNPFSVDITEIDGFDNLHHPEGILKASMERAAEIYGADRTYYLVNGSTCGILSAICACVRPGGKILMARNSHKAAYHAAFLRRLHTRYVDPGVWEEFRLQGGIEPERVERALLEEEGIQAVFITSPTYEGMVSDVSAIAGICHGRGIPLIVDEAHGAHFSFGGKAFPGSALDCGADLVIQSLHKTLPSLTQTAVLHLKSGLVLAEQVEWYLQMFQSSSPSYVLLASIENCIHFMDGEGKGEMRRFGGLLRAWMEKAETLRNLRALPEQPGNGCGAVARDLSKIVISTEGTGMTGAQLAERLRARYHLEPEMSRLGDVLFMTSLMDSEAGLDRLWLALKEIDGELEERSCRAGGDEGEKDGTGDRRIDGGSCRTSAWTDRPAPCMSIGEAMEKACERRKLDQACGRISGGFVTIYPPGIPNLVPGEQITGESIELIRASAAAGLAVEGLSKDGMVLVVRTIGNGV